MTLLTMGFTQKTARQFFSLIKSNKIDLLIDIRLNNVSQLAGFTKGGDLEYFLSEICQCRYIHCIEFAPTKEILDNYKNKKIGWNEYKEQFLELMEKRGHYKNFEQSYGVYANVCLLCSEPTPINCHRSLVAEIISKKFNNVTIKNI